MDSDKMKECFMHSARDMEYLTRNYADLARRHDRKWIAIFNRKVIGEADTLEELAQTVRGHAHSECLVVEYVTTEPVAMFF